MVEKTQLRQEFDRAAKIIEFMADYIGQMAPGKYQELYTDLNKHFLFTAHLQRIENTAGITDE